LIIWDKNFNPKQRRRFDQKIIKILKLKDHLYILYENGGFDKFGIEDGVLAKSNLTYPLKDFTFQDERIVVCGETLIQSLFSNEMF